VFINITTLKCGRRSRRTPRRLAAALPQQRPASIGSVTAGRQETPRHHLVATPDPTDAQWKDDAGMKA
jgi:hypothetical protein